MLMKNQRDGWVRIHPESKSYIGFTVDPEFLEFLHRLTNGGHNDRYTSEAGFESSISRGKV